jgi:VWFA-related protein
LVASLASLRPDAAAPRVQQKTRTVYVSVADKSGAAVTDLQAADFEVKVAGKPQTVASAAAATVPLRIALLVADQGTGAFQQGIARFMQKLLGHAEFALISVIAQPEKVVDYSPDGAALSAGLGRLGPRGRQIGGQLMEAIVDATKDVRSETKRPVIVAMRLGGEAPSQLSGSDVREQLRKSGAILYVISTAGAQAGAPSQARTGLSTEQAQLADSELTDASNNLAQVLGDGSKDSGGRQEQVVATTLTKTVEQVADELLHQYEITYTLPDNLKAGDKISVASKRKGVTVRAPSRLPN